jgi:Phosphotransferase enzyme family.
VQNYTHDVTVGPNLVRKKYLHWADGEPEREWLCLSLLARHASGVAPHPIRFTHEGDAPVVVMERLPGNPLRNAPASADQIAALGRALRRIYAVPMEAIEVSGLRERKVGPTEIANVLRSALNVPRDLSECDDPQLVKQALDLAQGHLRSPGTVPIPRLTTMGIADLNPANVLWDGKECRLVDFEDGGLTEPAFELADHVEHIATRLADVYSPEPLVESVSLTDHERHRFRQYRILWATFWLIKLLPGNSGSRINPAGTTEMQARHLRNLLSGMLHDQ